MYLLRPINNMMSLSVLSGVKIFIQPIAFRCKHKSTIGKATEKAIEKATKKATATAKFYNYVFKKYLLLTNSITSALFMGLGDCFQQGFEGKYVNSNNYDWIRTGRMTLVGSMLGPLHHIYYIQLDRIMPKSNFYTALKKIFLDQTIASPLTLLFFFIAMGVLEDKPLSKITNELTEKLPYVYLGDCVYWPPIQFINFYYLPTKYRVLYINAATMIFNIFLSYMKHFHFGY